MGTFYNVMVYTHKKIVPSDLKQKIEVRLKKTNQQMSLYLKSSEISKFNRADKDENIHISKDFYKVITQAEKLYKLTDGAWDGTVKPLYDLWNFDKTKKIVSIIPDKKSINACLTETGFQNIIIKEKSLTKKISSLNLDLGSIAKGYGVDAVVALLKSYEFKNFFVEIGGEVFVAGLKRTHKKWKVGISMPTDNYNTRPYKVLKLSNKALATSGTYRNFFKINKKTYSHIIDPKTGRPIDNNIVSVSVLADNCMLADGLATGLMVMGKTKALRLIDTLDNVECMIIMKKENKEIESFFSKDFEKYLSET